MTTTSDVHAERGAGTPDDEVAIRLRGLHKVYDNGVVAVDNLNLDVRRGELVCLVGPSGCGKTTTMKMINRLITPTSGRVEIDGGDVGDMNPVQLRRGIGYVIQQVGLFPHENIWNNVGEVPRLLGWPRKRRRDRADELLRLVGLDPATYGDRYPAQLSGGQQQRVGVARARAADPPVLLMDEPFSAIDPIARAGLQREFIRIQGEVRKTIVMVTHDIEEALFMADRIAVFGAHGAAEQFDTPAAILARPANEFVEDFVGGDRGIRQLSVTSVAEAGLAPAVVVDPTASVPEARAALQRGAQNWAVVLDEKRRPVGWVARGDLSDAGQVEAVMRSADGICVSTAQTLRHAAARILERDESWVLVVDDASRELLGALTLEHIHSAVRAPIDGDDADRSRAAGRTGTRR
jgi:osmoprotectant transport system ATP-binding protein